MSGKCIGKVACPKCTENGGDSKGVHLHVNEDKDDNLYGVCHVCSYNCTFDDDMNIVGADGSTAKKSSKPQSDKLFEEYLSLGDNCYRAVHNVTATTAKMYGVKSTVSLETGEVDKVYYPYYDANKNLVGVKVRIIDGKKFYWLQGSKNKECLVFGSQLINRRQLFIVVEGEKDALALSQLVQDIKKDYLVVSIRDGASNSEGSVDPSIGVSASLLTEIDNCIILLDNDAPGQVTTKNIANQLMTTVKNVKVGQWPEGFKDAHDYLLAVIRGKENKVYDVLNQSRTFQPKGIVSGSDISLDMLKKTPVAGIPYPYAGIQDKLNDMREGELTVLVSSSGAGKSTLSRELMNYLINKGIPVGGFFLEENVQKTAQALIALDNNIPLPRLRKSPEALPDANWKASYEKMVANGRTYFYDHFGSMHSDELLGKMRYLVTVLGVKYIFLDHLSMVVSASDESNDERKLLDMICTKLAAFCTETGASIFMVVHMRKSNSSKDKNATQGGMITLDDLRGSGGIAQLSWNVIALLRDTTGESSDAKENKLDVFILKNREWGYTGKATPGLKYVHQIGRLMDDTDATETFKIGGATFNLEADEETPEADF